MFELLPGEHMLKDLVQVARQADIAVISVDNPPVNTITAAVRAGLARGLDEVAGLAGVKAVVLRCEGGTFFSGADLGGGLEIALACHYRIAAPGTRFGLPEVTLGIIPGAGGTQRLPRLIGADKALELILDARPVDADEALRYGFLDAVVDGDLGQGGVEYARALLARGRGPRRTGEHSVDPATGTQEIFDRFVAQAKEHYPNRVAPLTAIEAVRAFAPAVRRGPAPRGQA